MEGGFVGAYGGLGPAPTLNTQPDVDTVVEPPICKIIVKLGSFCPGRGATKKSLKPPPRDKIKAKHVGG